MKLFQLQYATAPTRLVRVAPFLALTRSAPTFLQWTQWKHIFNMGEPMSAPNVFNFGPNDPSVFLESHNMAMIGTRNPLLLKAEVKRWSMYGANICVMHPVVRKELLQYPVRIWIFDNMQEKTVQTTEVTDMYGSNVVCCSNHKEEDVSVSVTPEDPQEIEETISSRTLPYAFFS